MNQAQLRRWAAWGARKGPNWFVRLAPPVIGFFAFIFASSARRAVRSNLRRINGQQDLAPELGDTIATFGQFARNLTEALCPERFGSSRRLIIRGHFRIDRLLEDSGIIMVTAHIGPWDSAAMTLTQICDRPVLMLMAGESDVEASQIQDDVRHRERVQVVRLGDSPFAALAAVPHLAQGGVVVAQLDRPFGERSPVRAQLFGQAFDVGRGLLRLSASSRCPLLPVFMGRFEDGARLVQVGYPIRVKPRPDELELQVAAQSFVSQMEAHLIDFPNQWFHFIES